VYSLRPRHLGWLFGLVVLISGVLAGCDSLNPATPVPPTATPEPPSTVALGTFDCGPAPGNAAALQLQSCWRGKLNGAYVTVGAGYTGLSSGAAETRQGVILVVDGPDLYHPPANGFMVYNTPRAAGSVRIRAGLGPQLTLVTADPTVTFTFDLQTRQWVNP
jgi:hypothetical protein